MTGQASSTAAAPPARLHGVPGTCTAEQLLQTARSIAAVQEPTGAIPWFRGGHTDPWDHVECAMALDVMGLHAPAARAYDWLADTQRPDGSWAARHEQGRVTDPRSDANFCGYVAVGVWHHHLATGDVAALRDRWPMVCRAIGLVVSLQLRDGGIEWTPGGQEALLAGSSSLYQALRCGLAIADVVGVDQPDWELAAGRLGHALRRHPERFADKSRWSMDWYYPVLGGAVRGQAARDLLRRRWDEFVVDGLGIRCVADRPWVTGAETCELVIALEACGMAAEARQLFAAMQHLRDEDDGAYWTGWVYPDQARWPVERSTWTAAAVILAADALTAPRDAASRTADVFRGGSLPVGVDPDDIHCAEEQPRAIERSEMASATVSCLP